MLNLLPPSEKQILEKEKKYKIVLILEVIVLCSLICFCLILLCLKIYISGQIVAEKIILDQIKQECYVYEIEKLEKNTENVNNNLVEINKFYKNRFDSSFLLAKISDILPQDVYLTNFSFTAIPKSKKQESKDKQEKQEYKFLISISGFSESREKLYQFKQALESQQEFKEIYLPPSNWAKSENIDFYLNFKI